MRTLLLADDNIIVQRVIALTFAGEPIQVVAVGDGQQAMEKLSALQPDIVLAGTTLPNVDGYELARFMRSKTELQMVPVLLLAGAFETVDVERLASSGANGVLEKPVEPTTLINRVNELLGVTSDSGPGSMADSSGRSGDCRAIGVEPTAPEIKLVAPEITDEMLDQIASRVADRLSAAAFGETLKTVVAATMRESVRNIVSETSERLVREEIERIKSRNLDKA